MAALFRSARQQTRIFMRNHAFRIIALAIILSAPVRAADEPENIRLARELFENSVTVQAEPMVDRMLLAASRQGGVPDAHLKIYREELLKVLRSEAYRGSYLQAYTDTFSLEELKSLVELSKHPAFGVYLSKSQRITELTYPTFVRLQKESKIEVERRIRELDGG